MLKVMRIGSQLELTCPKIYYMNHSISIQERISTIASSCLSLFFRIINFYLSLFFFWLPKPPASKTDSTSSSFEAGTSNRSSASSISGVGVSSKTILQSEEGKSPSKSVMTQLILSKHVDTRGICFAGVVLSWMDIIGGVAARRHSNLTCVTASIDAVHFVNPCKIGQICIVKASVNRSWITSMEVIVSVEAEDMRSGIVNVCCNGYFTFCLARSHSVGGRPAVLSKLPPVIPFTMRERRRYHEAHERRNARLERKSLPPLPCVPNYDQELASGEEEDEVKRKRSQSFTESRPRLYSLDPTARDLNPLNITCSETYTEVTDIIFPEHCNSLGVTFGGTILKFMEYAAAIAANRFCRTHLLIASIDSISFLHSTRQGDIITVRAMVSAAFKHSVEVYCTVERESEGEIVVTNDGWLTLVSVTQNGEKLPVPRLTAVSKLEKDRQMKSEERRLKRLSDKDLIGSFFSDQKVK